MQCFKVFWTWVESDKKTDYVDEDINKPIAAMLEKGWRIVNVQSNLSNQMLNEAATEPFIAPRLTVSVLFEKNK